MAEAPGDITLPDGLTQLSLAPPSPRCADSGEISLPSLDINSSSLYNFLTLHSPTRSSGAALEDKENAPLSRSPTGDERLTSPLRKTRLADRPQNTPPSSFSGVRSRRKVATSSTPRSGRGRPFSISSFPWVEERQSATSPHLPDVTSLSGRSARRNSAELSAWAAVGSEFGHLPDVEAAGVGWQREVAEEMVRLSLGRSGFSLPVQQRPSQREDESAPAPHAAMAPTEPAKVRLAPDTPSRPRWADFLFPSPAPAPPSSSLRLPSGRAHTDVQTGSSIPRSVSGPAAFVGQPTVRLVSGSGARSVSAPLAPPAGVGVPSIGILPASPMLFQGEQKELVDRNAILPTLPAPTPVARPALYSQRASWSSFASRTSSSSAPRSSVSRSRSEVLSQPSQELSFAGFWNPPTAENSRIEQEQRRPRPLSMREVLAPRPVVLLSSPQPGIAEVRQSRPPSSQSFAGGRTSRASRTSVQTRPGSRLSLRDVRDVLLPPTQLHSRSALRNKEFRTDLEAVEDSRLYEEREELVKSAEEKECARFRKLFLFGFLAFPLWWVGSFTRSSMATVSQEQQAGEVREWKVWQGRCRAAAAVSTLVIVIAVVLALAFALQ
ncbi:hypothetical protein CALVIDRAFT_561334 [Calocera viscosa TUFC12733]|uniref:Transmembrane protein n=1 Tax=Calocera viscosa (strain TUFC12733) TaxID=1330018 RepID=A0A167Q6Z5_CALVF|nr:hypothetical protein CALVIDRAFT_561334 [Calocera viscosa TUFC12733]